MLLGQRAGGWDRGFSLAELLLVLVILGVLAGLAIGRFGSSRPSAVSSVLDQVEATLRQAQASTAATGRDVILKTQGTWASTTGSPFLMDPRPYTWPPPSADADDSAIGRVGAESERLVSLFRTRDSVHLRAGVATNPDGIALASSLAETTMFTDPANQPLSAALGVPLCTGDRTLVPVNGRNHQFTKGFSIVVTGLLDGGKPDPAGAVGVLVVPRNSSHIYRFIHPAGGGPWRRD